MVFLPVPRDKLLPWLVEGRGDIASANLTITDERAKTVDFSRPLFKNVSEILVSGAAAPAIQNPENRVWCLRKSKKPVVTSCWVNSKKSVSGSAA